jgi:hypothetical protein
VGVKRRRGPLEMALLRRVRFGSWIAWRNVLFVNLNENSPVYNAARLQLAIHWSSLFYATPANPPVHSVSLDRSPLLPERKAFELVASTGIPTLSIEQRLSRSLLQELSDRTRRIEERVHVERRLVARERGSSNVSAEAQELRRRMGPDWWRSEPAAPRQINSPSAPVNVEQIAETVMRQIDHRVSAWRERTGRI